MKDMISYHDRFTMTDQWSINILFKTFFFYELGILLMQSCNYIAVMIPKLSTTADLNEIILELK